MMILSLISKNNVRLMNLIGRNFSVRCIAPRILSLFSAHEAPDRQINNFLMTKRSTAGGDLLKTTAMITSHKDYRFSRTPNVESCRTINHRASNVPRRRDFFPSVCPVVAGPNS